MIALAFALIAAVGGVVAYGMKASSLTKQVRQMERDMRRLRCRRPAACRTIACGRCAPSPQQATLAIGWLVPPQLLELHVEVSQTKSTQFQITIDKVDGGRVMQIRRVARDSNRELRLGLNSSAFGPGDYLIRSTATTGAGRSSRRLAATWTAVSAVTRLAALRPADGSRPSASRACR